MASVEKAGEPLPFAGGGDGSVEKPAPLLLNGSPVPDDNHHSMNENNANGFSGASAAQLQDADVDMADVFHQQQIATKPSLPSLNFPLAVKQEEMQTPTAWIRTANENDLQHAEFLEIFRTLASDTDGGTVKLLRNVTSYVYGDNNDATTGSPVKHDEVAAKIEPAEVGPPPVRTSPAANNQRSMQKAVRRLLIPTAAPAAAASTTAGAPVENSTAAAAAGSPSSTMLLNALSILHRTAERRKDDAFKQRNDNVLDDVMDTGEVSQRLALVRLPIRMLDSKIQMVDTVKLHQQQHQQKTAIEAQSGSPQKRLAVEKPPTKSLELERKYIKMKTANFYKRDNYNMLREASEGFSSLFYDLIICKQPGSMSPGQQQLMKACITDHVGYYEIDCFKVLEISLMACLFNVHAVDMVIEYAALLRPEPALLARFACRPMSFIATHSSLLTTAKSAAANVKADITAASSVDAKSRPSPARGSNRDASRDRASSKAPAAAPAASAVDSATETTTAVDQQAADERDITKASLYENAGVLLARLIDSELLGFEHIMSYVNELEEKPLDKIWEEANEEARQYAESLTSPLLHAVAGPLDGSAGGNDGDGDFDSSTSAATDNKDRRKKSSGLQLALSLNLKVQIASAFLQQWHIDSARRLVDLRQASAYLPIARCLSEMITYSIDLLYRDAVLSASRMSGYSSSSQQQQQQSFFMPFRPVYVNKQHRFSSSTLKSSNMLPAQLTSAAQLDSLSPLLGELNANLYIDCICMHRLLLVVESHFRTATTTFKNNADAENSTTLTEWIAWMFEICLLPAMSLTICNVSLANALWQCGLQYLPYDVRFLLYHRWAEFGYASHPELVRVRGEIRSDLKYAVKRLSKDKKSMEKFGRLLAKLSTCHPVLAHPYVLSRIESFGELTPIIVESFKFQFSMSLDALQFCMVSHLADPSRAGQKHDKLAIRPWFLYICEFLAQATRKVPVDMCGVLHYVVAELKDGKTVDLLVLKKLIEKISGIESSDDLTDEQLQALTGGTVLQQEVFCATSFRVSRKVTNRFREALISQDLTLPLSLLMVMQKNREIYAVADDKHLKLVGTMYDMCHDTLTQFCAYLSHIFTPQDYAATMPSLTDLCIQFRVPPDIALYLLRPLFFQAVKDELTTGQATSAGNVLTHSASASSLAPTTTTTATKPAPTPMVTDDLESLVFTKPVTVALPSTGSRTNLHAAASSAVAADADVAEKLKQANQFFDRWQQKLQPTATALRPLIRHLVTDVTPQFFVLFWTLSPHDLYVPTAAYDTQWKKLEENLKTDEHKSSHELSSKRRKEREKIRFTVAELKAEKKLQVEHVERVVHCLRRWSEAHLFTDSSRTRKNDFILQFIQVCLFPRCMFAPEEARFCAQFIQTIHELRTPFFSTVICYDRVLCDIRGMLMSCSEKEASRFGRMLRAALDTVMRWWSSPVIFERECRGHPGFVTKVRSSGSTAASSSTNANGVDDEDEVTYDNYRHLVYKWHFKLTKTMVDCIESRDYMQVRNALTILTHLPPHFPKLLNFYSSLEKKVDNLREHEDKKHGNRPDLFALATSYSSRLRQQKALCVLEEQFHLKHPTPSAAPSTDKKQQQRAAAGGGQNAGNKPKDNATAPLPSNKTADQSMPKSSTAADVKQKADVSSHQQPKQQKDTATNASDKAPDTDARANGDARRRDTDAKESQRPPSDARKPSATVSSRPPSTSTSPVTGSGGDRRSNQNKNDGNNGTRREKSTTVSSSPENAGKQQSSKHQQHDEQSSSSSGRAQPTSRDAGGAGETVKKDEMSSKRSSSRADGSSNSGSKRTTTATAAPSTTKQSPSSSTAASKSSATGSTAQSSTQQQSLSRPQQTPTNNDEERRRRAAQDHPPQRRSDANQPPPPPPQQQQQRPPTKRPLEQSSSGSSSTNAAPQKQQQPTGGHTTAPAKPMPSTASTSSPTKKLRTASEAGGTLAGGSNSAAGSGRSGAGASRPQQPASRKTSNAAQEFEFSSDDDEPVNNNKHTGTHNSSKSAGPPPPMPPPRSSNSSTPAVRTAAEHKPPPPRMPPTNTSQQSSTISGAVPPRQPPPPLPAAAPLSRKVAPPPSPAGQPPPPPMAPSHHQQLRRNSTDDGRLVSHSNSSNSVPTNSAGAPRAAATVVHRSTSSEQHSAVRTVVRPVPPPTKTAVSTAAIAQQHEDIDDDEDDDFDVADVFDQA